MSSVQPPQGHAELKVTDETINGEAAAELCIRLETCNVSSLHLANCSVTDWSFLQAPSLVSLTIERLRCERSLALLEEALPSHLERLVLRHCSLEYAAGGRLLASFRRLINLKQLEITLCKLCNLQSMRLGRQLQYLDLSENHIDNLDWLAMQTMTSELTFLSLSDNNLGTYQLDRLIHVPHLEELDVSHNEICSDGVQYLLQAKLPLRRLNLECCWVGHRGSFLVAELLKTTPTLEYLNISDNVWGDVGTIRIVRDGLCHSSSIQYLNLAANNITEEGALVLAATVLTDHVSLQGLGLSRNSRISSTGWNALAKAVACNPRLDTVETFGNALLFHENGIAMIRLDLDVLRTVKLTRLLEEERSQFWPLLLSKIANEFEWGYGLIFELLRRKPAIVV